MGQRVLPSGRLFSRREWAERHLGELAGISDRPSTHTGGVLADFRVVVNYGHGPDTQSSFSETV